MPTPVTLDGVAVAVSQSVYDVAYGTGTVSAVDAVSNRFTVDFTSRSLVYSGDSGMTPGGVSTRFTARTLFWQNPVVVPPPPTTWSNNGVGWTQIRTVMQAVSAAFH